MVNDRSNLHPRRNFLRQLLSLGVALPLSPLLSSFSSAANDDDVPGRPPRPTFLLPDDHRFLDEMERLNFQYFWDQANPETGLVRDRCSVISDKQGTVASIAATGFGLTAMCIGEKRQYIATADAQKRVMSTLTSLWNMLPNHRGFFYHWADINNGERVWDSEISSVDTAILLCGVLTCREHFKNRTLTELASAVFDRVDWAWLSEDTTLLPHGWTPEFGFLPYRWDNYSELMMMYLLGMGSGSHPLRPETWSAWKRLKFEYAGIRYIGSFAPLFVHQYSQAWFDFRGKHDRYADYFHNSILATDVHRRFCLELAEQFPTYSNDLWGITASDSKHGYVVWGGPPAIGPIDGTVAPSAAGGSIPFLPQPTMRVLKNIRNRYEKAWSKYGFVNAFNPLQNWYDSDVIGIDTGVTMVMAENARTGFVWDTFMKSTEAKRGMALAGFTKNQ